MWSAEALAISEMLIREGIHELHHFTSVENLPSISQSKAILSKAEQEERGVVPERPGGTEKSRASDRKRGNWDRVHLFFNPHAPMIYRVKQK